MPSDLRSSADVQTWLCIANGEEELPAQFQRFIAAWEVVVLWHRTQFSGVANDTKLKKRLRDRLSESDLETSAAWQEAYRSLRPFLPIRQMSGAEQTEREHSACSPDDWKGIVDVLYTVRCNLLKAGKRPRDDRDLEVAGNAAAMTVVMARYLIGAQA